HHHFLTDARYGYHAPVLARPGRRETDPARTILVLLSDAIPMELHLDAAILIGVNFLTARPHHNRRLHALHLWVGRLTHRAIRCRVGHGTHRIFVLEHVHAFNAPPAR